MDMIILVERTLAIFYFTCGLSLLLNPAGWLEYVKKTMVKDHITWGIISVFMGSLLVSFHNIWEYSPVLITTIIAWCALVKGLLFLAYPNLFFSLIKKINPGKCCLRLEGLFSVVLAGIIYYYTL